jgi:hypothetical protein
VEQVADVLILFPVFSVSRRSFFNILQWPIRIERTWFFQVVPNYKNSQNSVEYLIEDGNLLGTDVF